jgi:hypothetical protein
MINLEVLEMKIFQKGMGAGTPTFFNFSLARQFGLASGVINLTYNQYY